MCRIHALLPRGIHPHFLNPSDLEQSTTRYKQETGNHVHFCKTCGAHMGVFDTGEDQWYISTALFPKDEDVFVLSQHVYTQSAPCGLHEWLPKIGTRELEVWNPSDDSARPVVPKAVIGNDGVDRLLAECHCRNVSFLIDRPKNEVLADSDMKTFVSPIDKTKWKACLDTCNDCRLASGTHVSAWMYVPTMVCDPRESAKLTIYSSSPGKCRGFCGTCGATVCFTYDRPGVSATKSVSCIAVGILHAPEGVRADTWLTWRTEEVGWLDAGRDYDKELYESLNSAYRAWGIAKDGRALDFRLIQS
ncbi:hypothetical protein PG994_000170 [Apiospora phragmitis]|uniref:CENP-V/GFA domain-containing protein n=1 Tax=Apiospora phragmitis TaxID=2905665 RepID=A0ABR1X5G8_9PEZI